MIGLPKNLGGTQKHSFAYVVIPSGCSSRLHYHPSDEETYYVLKGKGRMTINGKEHKVTPGDAILIHPPEKHQIFSDGADGPLEFIVVSAPAWQPSGTVFL